MISSMKKLFALPVIWLILGAVAIATEIKTTNLIPAGQQFSGAVITCIKSAVEKRETTLFSTLTTYQNDSLTVLTARKTALLDSWNKSTKLEIKSAVSSAWKAYKSSMLTLKSTLNASRNTAWTTYKADIKSCKWTSLLQNIDTSSVRNEQ